MSETVALDYLAEGFKKNSGGPEILFDRVSLCLGGNEILKEIDIKIDSGTIHCIIGPNGGGKTSLVRSLLGQTSHTGTIQLKWPAGRSLGYMPQILDFDRTLPITVVDFMSLAGQNKPAFFGAKKKNKEKIRRTLEAVRMTGKETRLFGHLSGGEKQRVLLAQALYPSIPGLLLLDEPTAGVDEAFTSIFEDILAYLKNLGVTIVWINHNLSQVRKTADAVSCINKKLLFSGGPGTCLSADTAMDIFS